jgi:hypothetical protein
LSEVVVQTNFAIFFQRFKVVIFFRFYCFGRRNCKTTPALTIQNALQGQAAGVQVTGSNGKPGAAAFVTVRGGITGGSAQAIYVVDGALLMDLRLRL